MTTTPIDNREAAALLAYAREAIPLPMTEDEERAWRMSLAVGDEVAIISPDNPEWGHKVMTIQKIARSRIYTEWESFFQETGNQTGHNPYFRITVPTDAGRKQRTRYEEAGRITAAIRKTPLEKQPLSTLRALAWLLDIEHGPAPGFATDDGHGEAPGFSGGVFDAAERADTLETLMASVGFESASVHGFSGSVRTMRQAAASVVGEDGPHELYGVSLCGLLDVPTGNGPQAELLAHLIAYALRSLPDYIARLRREVRQSDAPIASKPHTWDTVRFDAEAEPSYVEHDDATENSVYWMFGQADVLMAVLCERLGGSVHITNEERLSVLPGLSLTLSWHEEGFILQTTREAK